VSNTSDANKPLSSATQTSLATKVDKVEGKTLSSNDYSTAEKTKLAAITGTNTGDQDLSGLAKTTALATKANATDVTAGLATKVDKVQGKDLSTNDFTTAEKTKLAAITGTNTGDQDLSGLATTTALATKANATDVTAGLATKVDKVQGKELSTNDYTTAEKTKLAAITGTNTGDQDLSGLATITALATKANATDVTAGLATKVDKVQGKELSTNDFTTAEKTKLAAITGTNTGDQDLSGLATTTALATKANATDVTAGLATKVDKAQGKELSTNDYTTAEKTKLTAITGTNTGDQDLSGLATTTALATKANATDVTAGLATKVDKVQGKELSTNDYTTAEKTKLAAITGTNTGDQDLTGLATTAALNTKASTASVTSALELKENVANKSTAVDLGGTSSSDLFYPTQKAVKAYVAANAASGGIADGGITTIKLADGAVTDAKVASGINKSKVGLGNVENTALSTWTGSSALTTLGTITSGTWGGTPIDYAQLNLTNSIVNEDISEFGISFQKLDLTALDLFSIGVPSFDDVPEYTFTDGLIENRTIEIGGRRFGGNIIRSLISIMPQGVESSMIGLGAVQDVHLDFGISKAKVGLSDVDNTSDLAKPISTATQTALDLKANTSDLTAALGLKADLNSPTFTGTVSGITKSMVGLGNVDNTADASKPISTAAQSALNLKAPLDSPTFTGTVRGITKAMVGLDQVDNLPDALKPISINMQNGLNLKANASEVTTSLAAKAPLNSPTFTGTVSGITKSMVGLGNVDNTADASKPISTATQTALDLKAPLESPTFTGTVSGITKSMVGLGNVENTVLSTWAGSTSLTTLGTVTSGTWQGTRLTVPFGGTGQTTLAANSVLLGNGTSGMLAVAPGTSGNVLSSNGTTWVSAAAGASSAGTLTGNTLASNVLTSSLTSVGTLTSLSSGSITSSGKVIVGSNTASTSSAVLEANSTSQGFLPPRMTAAQKNAISNPVPGLMLWCTNCGVNGELQIYSEDNTWKNLSGNTAAVAYTPAVGESYRGGVVAYVLQSSDPGYEASTPHGIIAATVDQSTSTAWSSTATLTRLNNGTGLGTGLANTNKIIALNEINNAAKSATEYNGGGYTDWYLPSQEEIRKLYGIRNSINFSGFYWTSSEPSTNQDTHAIYVRTDDINLDLSITKRDRFLNNKVRAIRSF
jgi:hypothetical protein